MESAYPPGAEGANFFDISLGAKGAEAKNGPQKCLGEEPNYDHVK